MKFRKIAAVLTAAAITLGCGCEVRSSNAAAWPTGSVENKEELTVTVDDFNKEYKYWMLVNQIADDTASETADECEEQRESIINYLINEKIVLDQTEKLGLTTLTDEEQQSIEDDYNSFIDSTIESFKSYVNAGESGTSEVNGDSAILEEAEKIFDEKIAECGLTRDDILMWFRNAVLADKLKEKLTEENTIEYSDAEAEFQEIVEGIQQVYENDPSDYESNQYYRYYWLPDNSRMIKHILIKFDSDVTTEITACRENNDDAGAEKVREKALEKLKPEIEEILNMLDNGGDFDELMQTYSEDADLADNPNGYLVIPNGTNYYSEFQEAAYELENVGDYMLVGTDLGWHIVMYASEAAVTEETKTALTESLLSTMQDNAATESYNAAMKAWREEYAYDIDTIKLNINPSATTEESTEE